MGLGYRVLLKQFLTRVAGLAEGEADRPSHERRQMRAASAPPPVLWA